MAEALPSADEFRQWTFAERLDWMSKHILLTGAKRPGWIYAMHFMNWAANYFGFALLALLVPRPDGISTAAYWRLLFVKFMVWQHLMEAIGIRQGPMSGHYGKPNNWRFRLSTGTVKYAPLSFLGKRRNFLDLIAHSLFFVACAGFLFSEQYQFACIRAVFACDAFIFCSDMTQFYASTGHGYWTMILSACFPADQGQLAGMQLALIFQWFFSGIGKAGPWFNYVNAPFMLQSRLFAGQRWLFNLLVRSEEDLSPTRVGILVAVTAAAVEYVAPIALMIPRWSLIWAGLIGIIGMHVYILVMPAPFDVYSWNTSYACCGVYLFYFGGVFGFDHHGLSQMNPWLAAALLCECLVCWYGQFFPNQVGYYLSHRYWAGNWVQVMFLVKNTEAVEIKLAKVKTFSGHPIHPALNSDPKIQEMRHGGKLLLYFGLAYQWLANMNMKCFARIIQQALEIVGDGSSVDDYEFFGLHAFCCGEFRDPLYIDPVLPTMQQDIGFEEGECLMLKLGAFGLFREAATWKIYDMKRGEVASGEMTKASLSKMHTLPSKSLDMSVSLAPGCDAKKQPLLA